jgi:DeoR/GlpR family transcriptional regulator of sugar metabolism
VDRRFIADAEAGLNERQRSLLALLAESGVIALQDYAKRFGRRVSLRQARSDLSDLVRRGFLARHGSARSTRYERTSKKA